jgi:hypothetical protein
MLLVDFAELRGELGAAGRRVVERRYAMRGFAHEVGEQLRGLEPVEGLPTAVPSRGAW